MERDFYPFVEEVSLYPDGSTPTAPSESEPVYPKPSSPDKSITSSLLSPNPARIAVYDDLLCAPRVLIVEPTNLRDYLNEITSVTTRLSHEQGGEIPFMVIREIVENFIHAYFKSPTISILDKGSTLKFTDRGPGIAKKEQALEFGTTTATEEMKHYIRGVGSGLPYVHHYMQEKGGYLKIEDNLDKGCVITLSSQRIPSKHTSDQTNSQNHEPALNERQQQVLQYMRDHGFAGSSDLSQYFGFSAPTWSRVLKSLAKAGLIQKTGQKYCPTATGATRF